MDLPTAWNINDKSDYLNVNSDGLRVHYTGPGRVPKEAAIIRTNNPIPTQCRLFYFEVDIINKGQDGVIGIGFCKQTVNLNMMPGLRDNLWVYHDDCGYFFDGARTTVVYGPSYTTGDTIGCCLNFKNNAVFYTKNGVNLVLRDLKDIFYPCIEFTLQGGSVEGNFGHRQFKYTAMTDDDIDEDLKKKWIETLTLYNDELINDLTKSLELKYRGKIYFTIGRYKQALEDLTKLLELEPNNAFALRYRGETYYLLGKYKESLRDLLKLYKLYTNDVWISNIRKQIIWKIK
ncbi:concanavalin A-like lectin/glucanase domain-containing protein [Glomus cerebriforme]|uniref:Concanavalin A-like lectin/glucanase domain-containing protein n=1 Tax=Glomus cerebriforme TaxID=658196 RepID=A0A397S7X8_9GLOM|nr:concanavalin A-like lectin/glucanase domain-containing protein [Glomus cerebriforme]